MEWIALGEIAEIQTGKLNANAAVENGKYPFFTCADENSYINEYAYDKECILVAGNGNLNVKYYNGKFNAYQRTYIIESKNKDKLNTMFLFYFMNTYMDKLRDLSIGGVIKYIKLGHLTGAKIPVPPMEIQKQIVEVLDAAQKLIDNRKEQIELLDDLIESIFYDMFGDPVRNDKRWEVKKLKEFGAWSSGGTPSRRNKEFFKGNINWFSAGELNTRYLYESNEKITQEAIENSSAKLFKKGTILIGMYDTAAFKLSILEKDSSSNQACANLKCNKNYNAEWVYTLFEIMKPIYLQSRIGVRQKNLSQKVIKNFNVISTPIELQNQFAEKVELIESQKELLEESLKLMEDNYNSLMQRAFKGELF